MKNESFMKVEFQILRDYFIFIYFLNKVFSCKM